MSTATGLDVLNREEFHRLRGKSIGLLCNQASVTQDFVQAVDAILPYHEAGRLRVTAVFGPQHGLFGHTQDNMIEWEGADDPRTGLHVYSLYGERREPSPESLSGIDLMVIDVPDVGCRYYTFAWTMALTMKACADAGIPVMVLDRPNPIGGVQVEGTVLEPQHSSFVGLYPLPMRHGMTIGEVATYVHQEHLPKAVLEVVSVEGWSRSDYLEDTDAPWAMPSPNMPTVDAAIVYPGACLLEATNLSEGRGTTKPFEMLGAPFIDGWKLAASLNGLDLPGVRFRPIQFEPTFNKHAGRLCEGVFVHVTERRAFEPVLTYVALLQETIRHCGLHAVQNAEPDKEFVIDAAEVKLPGFAWRRPPYEYESGKPPITILAGNTWLQQDIEAFTSLNDIRERMLRESADFEPKRREAMLYVNA